MAALVAAFLIGGPFAALAAGAWSHGMAQREQFAQEASRSQATAVVLAVTPPTAGTGGFMWQANARWKAPDGREATSEVPVPADTAVGGTFPVWTDRTGDLTSPPLLDSQIAGQTATGQALGVIVSAGVVALAGVLVRWSLNKRRMAAWDADWHAVGPRWTTRA